MRRLKARSGVRQQHLADGEAVALSPDGGQAVVLNPLGSVVLDLCDGTLDAGDIVALLADRFADVPRDTIAADVGRLVEALRAAQIVEEAEQGG